MPLPIYDLINYSQKQDSDSTATSQIIMPQIDNETLKDGLNDKE